MDRGVDKAWDDTDFFFGEDSEGNVGGDGGEGSFRRTLGRDYLRVSRTGLKEVLYGEDGSRKFDVIRENVSAAATTPDVFSPQGCWSCSRTTPFLRRPTAGGRSPPKSSW